MQRNSIALVLALVVAGLPVSGVICVTLCSGAPGALGAATTESSHDSHASGDEQAAGCHSAAPTGELKVRSVPAAACFELFDAVSARANALRAERADTAVVILDAAVVSDTALASRDHRILESASLSRSVLAPSRAPRVLRI